MRGLGMGWLSALTLCALLVSRSGWTVDEADAPPVETPPAAWLSPAGPVEPGSTPGAGRSPLTPQRFDFGFQINLKAGRSMRLGNGAGIWLGARYRVAPPLLFGLKGAIHFFQVHDQYGPDNVRAIPVLLTATVEHTFAGELRATVFVQGGIGISFNALESAYQYRIFGPPPGPTFHLRHSFATAVMAGVTVRAVESADCGVSVEWLRSVATVESDDPTAPHSMDVGHIGVGALLVARF